jgi:hypothetical protein
VRNDSPLAPLNATLTVTALSIATGLPVGAPLTSAAISLAPGAASSVWACLGANGSASGSGSGWGWGCQAPALALAKAGCAANGTDCLLRSVLTDAATGQAVYQNQQLWALPSDLALAPGVSVSATVGSPGSPGGPVPVTLHVQGGAAVLVCLSTAAQGRFSDNALVLVPAGEVLLYFVPMVPGGAVDAQALASSLRVEHLGMYM